MKHTRPGFAVLCFGLLLALLSALRVGLLLKFAPASLGAAPVGLTMLAGFYRDVFVTLLLLLPLLLWFAFVPERWAARSWHRGLFWLACLGWWLGQIFLLGVEFFFFDEFQSRFNTVAVDYILYPHEVFINIWDSYPVGKVLLGCGLLAGILTAVGHHFFARMWQDPPGRGYPWWRVAFVVILATALAVPINFKGANVGPDRTVNEIANNGSIAFACAAWTRNLDFAANYKTLPLGEAYRRVRGMLGATNVTFTIATNSIHRYVAGDATKPRLNVVLFLEESMGSEFWGCLGRTNTLTPEMDKLATEEGWLFENIYACGNRTVRGMEGVLASFPPLPGDSIVKRDRSENVETLARVLKRDDYATLFVYGGRGLFDGMRAFTLPNGYDRFVEQKDFVDPKFTTIWGVNDEELFARANEEFRDLARQGKPFFGTVLSVSNHKPYTYPAGRIAEDPNERRRENAVKFSDFALGQFFRAAKKEAYWTNTIFVVIADHGARVYGRQSIPIHSYEIPLVILGPAVVSQPKRLSVLGNSLDVAPTILGLLGRPYDSMFFGRDLFGATAGGGRVWLNHNRSVGLFAQDRLVVLGLKQSAEFYAGNPKLEDIQPLATPGAPELELEQDAIAVYQVADDLYMNRRYRIDGPKTAPAP